MPKDPAHPVTPAITIDPAAAADPSPTGAPQVPGSLLQRLARPSAGAPGQRASGPTGARGPGKGPGDPHHRLGPPGKDRGGGGDLRRRRSPASRFRG